MTIPKIDFLFLISMCGLSTVCVGFFAIVAFAVIRFASGGLFEGVDGLFGGIFGGNDTPETPTYNSQRVSAQRNLRAKAQQMDFDQVVQAKSQSASVNPDRFGENTDLRPDRRNRLNERARDIKLQPPGTMSDNPDVVNAPPPPDFSSSGEYIPNTRSNIGGRIGRHNTGRGQTGQRMDAGSNTSSGIGHNPASPSDRRLRSGRNASNEDELFGGMFDFDGDGDVDT